MEHTEYAEMNSILSILNDPLLTILGVLLVGCLWLTLPVEGDATTDKSDYEGQLANRETALEEDIEESIAHGKELKDKLADLDQQLAGAQRQAGDGKHRKEAEAAALGGLRQELEEAQRHSASLEEELQERRSKGPMIRPGNPVNKMTEKVATYFLVKGNAIAPITEDYFKFESGYYQADQGYVSVTVATRTRDGESVNRISNPTSDFAKALAALKPDSQCVMFIVYSDGFDTFRKAREIVRKADIQLGWEPYNGDDDKLLFSSTGRDPHVNP